MYYPGLHVVLSIPKQVQKTIVPNSFYFTSVLLVLLLALFKSPIYAQQQTLREYVIFGGNSACPGGPGQTVPAAPGCGVILSSNTTILNGSVGSYSQIATGSGVKINASIHSQGSI